MNAFEITEMLLGQSTLLGFIDAENLIVYCEIQFSAVMENTLTCYNERFCNVYVLAFFNFSFDHGSINQPITNI